MATIYANLSRELNARLRWEDKNEHGQFEFIRRKNQKFAVARNSS
jgi:hypothetical protein